MYVVTARHIDGDVYFLGIFDQRDQAQARIDQFPSEMERFITSAGLAQNPTIMDALTSPGNWYFWMGDLQVNDRVRHDINEPWVVHDHPV